MSQLSLSQAVGKYGPGIVLRYLVDCVFFDWRWRTDTLRRLANSEFTSRPGNLDQGAPYMPVWTSEVVRNHRFLSRMVNDLADYNFVDIGSGKGKAVLVWKMQFPAGHRPGRVLGIDYYEPLVRVAQSNHLRVFGDPGEFHCIDATQYDYAALGDRLVVFLFNPFGAELLGQVLARIPNRDVFVVYVNPVHHEVLVRHGFALIHSHLGPSPALQSMVFRRPSSMAT